jgi:hypothetical protein
MAVPPNPKELSPPKVQEIKIPNIFEKVGNPE